MLVEELRRIVPADLALRLHRQIDVSTGGRIRNLRVDVSGDRVMITGSAPSYYAKQLALLGVQEILGAGSERRVALDIAVGTAEFRAVEGHDAPHGRTRP